MSKVVEAIFENGVFKPLNEINLKNHQHVRIEILIEDDELSLADQKRILLQFAGIKGSNSNDVSRNHDRYLYVKE